MLSVYLATGRADRSEEVFKVSPIFEAVESRPVPGSRINVSSIFRAAEVRVGLLGSDT